MTVEKAGAEHIVKHQGDRHYFCSPGCRARFGLDPGAYVGNERATGEHRSEP